MAAGPCLPDAKRAVQTARADRLARALRDNLGRRKEQARQRDAVASEADAGEPAPAAKPPA